MQSRPLLLVLLAVALASFFVAATAHAQAPDLAERIVARDGTELATDVYLPDGDGPFPVLLRRTPYGRAVAMDLVAGTGSLGYALVTQDVRGRGDSDGEFLPFFDDANDGADTLDWIVEQPWSTGRVGTFGGSAEGIVQLMLLTVAHPAHACAHVTVATDDVHEAIYPGGLWRTELTDRWLEGLMEPAARVALRAHEARDAFWDRARMDETERARVSIPVLSVGGFFDIFSVGTPRTFASLAANASDEARDDQFLVLGAWTHGGLGTPTQGEVTWPMDAVYDENVADLVAFLGWCLKGEPRPEMPAVRYYLTQLGNDGETATGSWRESDVWPPASTLASLYLGADGLSRSAPTARDAAPLVLPVDPSDPVGSVGGSAFTETPGPHDQSAIDARPDVLVLDSAVTTEPVEIVGDLVARIWAASSTTDADVLVRVSQVTPSGRVIVLADGGRRGRFAESVESAHALTPGEPVLFTIDVGPIAIELPAGHALRVAISGTLAPRFEVNPGSADPIADDPTPVAHDLSIFADSDHPSELVVPVASGTLPGAAPPPSADAGPPGDDAGTRDDAGTTGPTDSGSSGSPDAGSPSGDDDGGCGCRIAGAPRPPGTTGLLLLLSFCAMVAVRARRRLLRTVVLTVAVASLLACSGDDDAPASPVVGGGCPAELARSCFEDQKGCASGATEDACFGCAVGSRAEPDGTCVLIEGMAWSHDFAEITTVAGGEVAGLCQSWTIGNETDLFVGTVELVQNESSHHSNWTFVPEGSFDGPDGIWPCEERGYDQLQAAVVGGVLYAQSTQSEHEVQRFPPGAAVRIPARSRIIGDVHLLNVSSEAVTGHASLTVYAIAPETVTVSLAPLHLTLSGLEIPARSSTRNSAECNIGTQVRRALRRPLTSSMYYLLPHTHSLATRFFVEIVGGPRDGEALIDLPAYDGESHGRWYDPPIDLTGITGLRFGCEWDNPRAESLHYGIGDQEMCELLAFIDDVAIEGSVRSVEERAPDGEMRVFDGPCDIVAAPWDR